MAIRTADFHTVLVPLIRRLPVGTYFDCMTVSRWDETAETHVGGSRLEMQAATQADVRALLDAFPGVLWTKRYDEACQWWTYEGRQDGVEVGIYAVREAPPTCTAIVEEREVEERVPVAFTRTVRKPVIVGWNCR